MRGCSLLQRLDLPSRYNCIFEKLLPRVPEKIAYDGNNHLALNEDLCFWTAVDAEAHISKLKLEQGHAAGNSRNYLEGDCRGWVHRHLENRKDTLLCKGTRGVGPP